MDPSLNSSESTLGNTFYLIKHFGFISFKLITETHNEESQRKGLKCNTCRHSILIRWNQSCYIKSPDPGCQNSS